MTMRRLCNTLAAALVGSPLDTALQRSLMPGTTPSDTL
jgi:hypothetical protein